MEPGGSRVMETELRASQVQTPISHNHHHPHHRAVAHHSFREESGDEELAVLPRHTKVIVTGNNRTKSVLVGLQGVVKSVGLGGWHFLVLKNGEEVKLQRNALSVLEPPTGKEDDGDCDNSFCSSSDRGDKDMDYTSLDYQKSTKPRVRHTRPAKRSRQKDPHSHSLKPQTRLDLSKLGTTALWRYWKHFNLVDLDANLTKEQLLHGVRHHFLSMQLDEMQVIMSFIQSARRVKVLDSEAEGLVR
ncbi:hypothetical protein LUZ61_019599 [Rhynchospora tenuis]|uniref:Histone deacetylase complex subunit SAP30 Sin3 binding domain-containing protein n=1 Tax=Rhynchospora tenuis TaxID=198213 RepID=A0AAD6EMY8_9POAL|nr:hypothetical protein LUZ61_019599 [Rhynchospora tenuis]